MDLLGIIAPIFHPKIKPYCKQNNNNNNRTLTSQTRIQTLRTTDSNPPDRRTIAAAAANLRDRSPPQTPTIPTMSDIMATSRSQNLEIRLQKLGPFFRVTAINTENQTEIGRAEGLVRVWIGGRILHLDSVRLRRESLGMEKSIFGISLFIGAVAIRHGYDCGCKTAELLAINDSDLYHSKLVRYYTRMGFKAVREVTGSSMGDVAHMLAWGGLGTRMDADITSLLVKWSSKLISEA